MEIVERYITSKTGQSENCEDAIYSNDHFACVVDGATSKSSWSFPLGRTAGWWAASILISVVENLAVETTLEQFIEVATQEIAEFYKQHQLTERVSQFPKDRLTASIAIFSRFHYQVWMIGDCQCLVANEKHTNPKRIDRLLSEVRAFYLFSELLSGKTIGDLTEQDTGRSFILPLLERQALFQNADIPYGYSVLDGFPVALKGVKQIQVSKDVTHLVLASDGYPDLASSLQESEERLQEAIARDPLCMTLNKSTKGVGCSNPFFDDRAYLKIRL
ncbi:protein phosphatase 2C domain-containing protein [Leptolyngbya sp. AN03gr2]|uniref:protein phosphatase 2C domain-containing protein n=1 Tax=unclassified Leptolyngbya TaxID=2650499 RepID=UPI003D31E9CD